MPFDTKAVRKAVPLLISVASVSGGGKTYSSLLLAAGLAGDGKVGMIDAENGRGAVYADSPGIVKALPNGYAREQLDPPFTPRRYVALIEAAEQAGITALVIDSASHEWEGTGGCVEMAQANRLGKMDNWALAKMEHKRFVNHCLSTSVHLIFSLRAREKVKIFEKGMPIILGAPAPRGADDPEIRTAEKSTVVSLGVQPIQEKNFTFEMLLSLYLDEYTHFAIPTKIPEPLLPIVNGKRLLTKEDGERIRLWNETGATLSPVERLKLRARASAAEGTAEYKKFLDALNEKARKAIQPIHEDCKYEAEQADLQREKQAAEEAATV